MDVHFCTVMYNLVPMRYIYIHRRTYRYMFGQERQKVLMVKRINNKLATVVGKLDIKMTTSTFTWKQKTYNIEMSLPAFKNGNNVFYFIDAEKSTQLLVGNENDSIKIPPDVMTLFWGKHVLKEFVTAEIHKPGMAAGVFLLIIFVALTALLGGYLLGNVLPF